MLGLHTNQTQGQRYWPHMEKFNGFNGNFLAFIYELIKQIGWTKENSKEGTRTWEIQERAIKYLALLYGYNLASKKFWRVNMFKGIVMQFEQYLYLLQQSLRMLN